jgi:hypothetical protein
VKQIWEAKLQMHLVQKLWKEGHSSLGLTNKDESVGIRKPSFYHFMWDLSKYVTLMELLFQVMLILS